jgi:hypothetical protein
MARRDHHSGFDIIIVTGGERKHIRRAHPDIDNRRSGEIGSLSKCSPQCWRRKSGIVSESDTRFRGHFCESVSKTIKKIIIDIDPIDTTEVVRARKDRVVHKKNINCVDYI